MKVINKMNKEVEERIVKLIGIIDEMDRATVEITKWDNETETYLYFYFKKPFNERIKKEIEKLGFRVVFEYEDGVIYQLKVDKENTFKEKIKEIEDVLKLLKEKRIFLSEKK